MNLQVSDTKVDRTPKQECDENAAMDSTCPLVSSKPNWAIQFCNEIVLYVYVLCKIVPKCKFYLQKVWAFFKLKDQDHRHFYAFRNSVSNWALLMFVFLSLLNVWFGSLILPNGRERNLPGPGTEPSLILVPREL